MTNGKDAPAIRLKTNFKLILENPSADIAKAGIFDITS